MIDWGKVLERRNNSPKYEIHCISNNFVLKVSAAAVTADNLTPSTISEANGHSRRPTSSLCEVVFRSDEVVVMNVIVYSKSSAVIWKFNMSVGSSER